MKPNREAIQEWVDALRSGKYPQSRKALRTDNGYCCLGVACDIAAQRNPESYRWLNSRNGDGHIRFMAGSIRWTAFPSRAMMQEVFGINSDNPKVVIDGNEDLVSYFNDKGLTFEQIADALEAKYLTVEAADAVQS